MGDNCINQSKNRSTIIRTHQPIKIPMYYFPCETPYNRLGDCGAAYENHFHYFLQCPLSQPYRDRFLNSLPQGCDLNMMLHGSVLLSIQTNIEICNSVQNYIISTKRFDQCVIRVGLLPDPLPHTCTFNHSFPIQMLQRKLIFLMYCRLKHILLKERTQQIAICYSCILIVVTFQHLCYIYVL